MQHPVATGTYDGEVGLRAKVGGTSIQISEGRGVMGLYVALCHWAVSLSELHLADLTACPMDLLRSPSECPAALRPSMPSKAPCFDARPRTILWWGVIRAHVGPRFNEGLIDEEETREVCLQVWLIR